MQSRTPLTPFEAAQMRAYTFSINVIGSMAFSETLKTLETIKEESLQVRFGVFSLQARHDPSLQ